MSVALSLPWWFQWTILVAIDRSPPEVLSQMTNRGKCILLISPVGVLWYTSAVVCPKRLDQSSNGRRPVSLWIINVFVIHYSKVSVGVESTLNAEDTKHNPQASVCSWVCPSETYRLSLQGLAVGARLVWAVWSKCVIIKRGNKGEDIKRSSIFFFMTQPNVWLKIDALFAYKAWWHVISFDSFISNHGSNSSHCSQGLLAVIWIV